MDDAIMNLHAPIACPKCSRGAKLGPKGFVESSWKRLRPSRGPLDATRLECLGPSTGWPPNR